MRLPPRFRNRWSYAGAAALGVMIFLMIWTGAGPGFDDEMFALSTALVISASAPAALYWPRGRRSLRRMALTGILVVLTAFFLFLPLTIFFTAIAEGRVATPYFWGDWIEYFPVSLVIVIFGSIFTLGLPYLIGVLLSFLFADEKIVRDD